MFFLQRDNSGSDEVNILLNDVSGVTPDIYNLSMTYHKPFHYRA